MLTGKKIVVCVTGGIAAYKSCLLVRELKKQNAEVRVVTTHAATQFVHPLTFKTLSENAVITSLFSEESPTGTIHIDTARWADTIIVAPATANCIAKIAAGIADDAVSTLIAAADVPVIFCPAMNKEMYAKRIFQGNMQKLRDLGYRFVEAEQGSLACGEEGWGRLAELNLILDEVKMAALGTAVLNGVKAVVTASRTEENIDPVRYVTNHSSGKMGFAIAEIGALMGAEVHLVSGPSNEVPFAHVTTDWVRTSSDMAAAVEKKFADADVLIMAAAVTDFRPKQVSATKIKKDLAELSIGLEKTEDIVAKAGKNKGKKIVVGFALETDNEIENARQKLIKKNLDFIVLNNPQEQHSGFGSDTNKVTIISSNGSIDELEVMPKREVAQHIWDKILALREGKK